MSGGALNSSLNRCFVRHVCLDEMPTDVFCVGGASVCVTVQQRDRRATLGKISGGASPRPEAPPVIIAFIISRLMAQSIPYLNIRSIDHERGHVSRLL